MIMGGGGEGGGGGREGGGGAIIVLYFFILYVVFEPTQLHVFQAVIRKTAFIQIFWSKMNQKR